MGSGPPIWLLTTSPHLSLPILCLSHIGRLSVRQMLLHLFLHFRPFTQDALPSPFYLFKSYLFCRAPFCPPAGKPSQFSQLESLSPSCCFRGVCMWLSPPLPILTCILGNLCIFLTTSPFILVTSHSRQKKKKRGGIQNSPACYLTQHP